MGQSGKLSPNEFETLHVALGGVRVLGLGEPTHGSAEAFAWKGEVILALAQAGLLRVLAWECGYASGRQLDRALRWGEGDLRAALTAQNFWTWNTREVLNVLLALQKWNQAQPESQRVRFVGVDVQEPYSGVQDLLLHHPRRPLHGLTKKGLLEAGSPAAAPLLAELRDLEAGEADPERRALARNAARFVDTYLMEAQHKRLGLRDSYMAHTLLEEGLDSTGLTVFWAHNEHVAVNPDFAGDPASGLILREKLGAAYLGVGMLLGQGKFRVRDLDALGQPKPITQLALGLPAPHHSDALFLKKPAGLYPTRDFAHAGPRRFLGGHYGISAGQITPKKFEMARPLSDFDLIRWFPETGAAHSLDDGR